MNETLADRMNGTAVKVTRKASKASKASKAPRKASNGRKLKRGEIIRAVAFFSLACAGLAISLPHLASEVYSLTGASAIAAWCLAIVIDLGMVTCKAHLSAHGPNRSVAWAIVAVCTALSMVLNGHAFLAHAVTTFGIIAAVGFGCFLPLFIVALSFLGSEILNGRK